MGWIVCAHHHSWNPSNFLSITRQHQKLAIQILCRKIILFLQVVFIPYNYQGQHFFFFFFLRSACNTLSHASRSNLNFEGISTCSRVKFLVLLLPDVPLKTKTPLFERTSRESKLEEQHRELLFQMLPIRVKVLSFQNCLDGRRETKMVLGGYR